MDTSNSGGQMLVEFKDNHEAIFLLNSLWYYKHGQMHDCIRANKDACHRLEAVGMASANVLELSQRLTKYIDENNVKLIPNIIYEDIKSPSKNNHGPGGIWFDATFDNLKHSCKVLNWDFSRQFESQDLDRVRFWLKCYFAPCIIDDEVANFVISELNMFGG